MGDAPRSPVLALIGPTASGKSGLAMEAARARRTAGAAEVEIVAIDAFTVYRGMDLGTATPTRDERAEVAHHLVDALEPWQDVSVAWFQRRARAAIDDIHARDRVPLLVGGSGLYFRAVVDDLRFPPTDRDVRARIERRYAGDPAAAHAALAERDPAAAAKIEEGNLRRSVRALEVIELTGRAFSSFATAWEDHTSIYPGLEVVYVEPDGELLRERIRTRTEDMIAVGLLDEVQALRELGRPLSHTAAQAIGYAEAFAVLDGTLPADDLADAIAQRTWRFARDQRAWFRRDPRCVPVESPSARAALAGAS